MMNKFLTFLLFVMMAATCAAQLQPVNVGSAPNDRTGDNLRDAMIKLNANDEYLENRIDEIAAVDPVNYDTIGILRSGTMTNAMLVNNEVKAQGSITLTNGSANIVGVGTNFLDTSPLKGLSYWYLLWVQDSVGVWFRISISSITDETNATISTCHSETQLQQPQTATAGAYGPSVGTTTFSGVSGTYEFYTVKNFSKGPFTNSFGNNSYVGGSGFGTVFGGSNVVLGTGATAFGTRNYIGPDAITSFASGSSNTVLNPYSFSVGWGHLNQGQYGMTLGYRAIVQSNGAFAGGLGTSGSSRWIRTVGVAGFTFSRAVTKGVNNSGDESVILGGRDHTIPNSSERSAIIGGDNITIAANVDNTVHMPKIRFGLGNNATVETDNTNENVLVRDADTGEIKIRSASTISTGWPLSGSASLTAPVSINTGTNYVSIGSNISHSGSGSYNFLTGMDHSITTASGSTVNWATSFGEANSFTVNEPGQLINNPFIIGGYLNSITLESGAGNIYSPFIIGTRNTITNSSVGNQTGAMVIGYRSSNEGDMNLVTGFRGHATSDAIGGFVHGFSSTYTTNGNWTGTVEPVTIGGRGAINISSNTESQTAGHGAYADHSAILGGVDADIPSGSDRSVILGGNGIKARSEDPDQVYVPNLNIVETPDTDNELDYVLAWDESTGEVKKRTVAYTESGTYTPTLTNGSNVEASNAGNLCYYTRIGNVVQVSGWITVDVTSAGVATNVGLSLPVAANFTDTYQLSGNGLTASKEPITIISDQTNDEAYMIFSTSTTNNQTIQFSFMYRIP